MTKVEMTKYDSRHGGPYDRGAADSYYGRPQAPHCFVGGTYASERVPFERMTPDELAAYRTGYEDNEESGSKKDWG